MTLLDWILVIGLNGAIIVYGLFRASETQRSADWFLAGRTLSWWVIGFSLWATAIDASDLVADTGGTYSLGIRYFVTNWVGTVAGWVLAANFIVLPMYRAGIYTNAEYLEARFEPLVRVISALMQVQYRSLVLGIIATTIYLTLTVACEFDRVTAWITVGTIGLLATVYTALGGLKSVAITDALQSVVMIAASFILFAAAWHAVSGWSGLQQSLNRQQAGLADRLLHVGAEVVEREDVGHLPAEQVERRLLLGGALDAGRQQIVRRTPAWLAAAAFFLIGVSYSVVNHTQSMRMLGARSERDLRLSAVLAGSVLIVTTFTNLMIGVIGRALYPAFPADVAVLQTNDVIYPLMVRELTGIGLKGLVVAGILAASFSTFDSIGSTLSSLLVRDVYARLLVTDRDDHHYLRVGQWLTPVIIFGSFAYIPFLLESGMLMFYIDVVGAFIAPLLTVYVLGVSTRVHRRSALAGMLAGVGYGVLRLFAPRIAVAFGIQVLPSVMVDGLAGWLFGVFVTGAVMILFSLVFGWTPAGELLHEEKEGWLQASQYEVRRLARPPENARSHVWATVWSWLVVLTGAGLSFIVFW